jgi:hypothetical protein
MEETLIIVATRKNGIVPAWCLNFALIMSLSFVQILFRPRSLILVL